MYVNTLHPPPPPSERQRNAPLCTCQAASPARGPRNAAVTLSLTCIRPLPLHLHRRPMAGCAYVRSKGTPRVLLGGWVLLLGGGEGGGGGESC
jgi:hypothetical protein